MASESSLVKELKIRIADVLENHIVFQEDWVLLLWLTEYKLKLDDTETAIRKSVKWRVENPLRAKLTTAEKQELFPMYGVIPDKNGKPLILSPIGSWDCRTIVEAHGGKEAMVEETKHLYKNTEEFYVKYSQYVKQTDPNSECRRITVIISAKHYSAKQLASFPVLQGSVENAKIFYKYYPAIFDTVYFINVNRFFKAALQMVIPFIKFRIVILDGPRESWTKTIEEFVSLDKIPPEFGGTNEAVEKTLPNFEKFLALCNL